MKSASTVFKVWAISLILGVKDTVLDKKIDGRKWSLPRELVEKIEPSLSFIVQNLLFDLVEISR